MKLRTVTKELLEQHASVKAAATALATMLGADAGLRSEIALAYLTRSRPGRRKKKPGEREVHSRRRVGPHRRSPLPSEAQKTGALAAEKAYAADVFNRKMRGGRQLGEIRIHELRAIAESSASMATSFLQRGYDDAVETLLCVMLSKHCISSDPFAPVKDVIKASVATAMLTKAKIKAAELLRDHGAKVARELVAAAHQQELSQ